MRAAKNPWERWPGETDKSFAAFRAYRDLGFQSRVQDVVEMVGTSLKQANKWCAQFDWRDRSSCYDDFLDREKVEAEVEAIREMAKRHVGMAKTIQTKVMEKVAMMKSDDIPAYSVPAWMKCATEMERLARNIHTGQIRTERAVGMEQYDKLLEDPDVRRLLFEAANRAATLEDNSGLDDGRAHGAEDGAPAPPANPK